MTGSRRKGIAVLLVCISLSACWSVAIRHQAQVKGQIRMVDFAAIYYGARCVMHGENPYDPDAFLREYEAKRGGQWPGSFESKTAQSVATVCINLPTSLFLMVPFALLPWVVAQNLWMVLTAGLLALAAVLMWDLGGSAAPAIWICLAGFMLLNWELPLVVGNSAGVAVSLCVIAVWCFLRERYVWVGILLLGVSLVIKPHDAGFVWLYFLLAGGVQRKRALQTLAVAGILGLCAALWIAPVSPHWFHEVQRNIAAVSAPGTVNYPGPSGASMNSPGPIIALQAMFSVLWEDPRFYNSASYLVAGFLILVWILKVARVRPSLEESRFALAAISVLTLLPVYHRPDDSGLLLLMIPACAMLWAGGGPRRWPALVLTSAAIFFTSDIPLAVLVMWAKRLSVSASTLAGKLTMVLVLRPTPIILLAAGCFYLWILLRYNSSAPFKLTAHDTTSRSPVETT